MHSLKEAEMIVAKIDLLAKRLESCEKMSAPESMQAMESHMTCEIYGEVGHSWNHCSKTHEDLNFINNSQGWNQHSNSQGNSYNNSFVQCPNNQGNGYPSFKDLVSGQGRITDNINNKLNANDKLLDNINAKLDDFSSAIKNQFSFNKILETQLAQLAAAIPSFEKDRIPGKLEPTLENANLVCVSYSGYDIGQCPVKRGDPRTPVVTCNIKGFTF
jgi:hypothetical protein